MITVSLKKDLIIPRTVSFALFALESDTVPTMLVNVVEIGSDLPPHFPANDS